jgi:hypothetical protein
MQRLSRVWNLIPKFSVGVPLALSLCIAASTGTASSWSVPKMWCDARRPPPSMNAVVNGIVCSDSTDHVVALIMEPGGALWSQDFISGQRITSGYAYQICNGGNSIPAPFIFMPGANTTDHSIGDVQKLCNGSCSVWPLVKGKVEFSFDASKTPPQLTRRTVQIYPDPPGLPNLTSAGYQKDYNQLVDQFLKLYLQTIRDEFDTPSEGLFDLNFLAQIDSKGQWNRGEPLTQESLQQLRDTLSILLTAPTLLEWLRAHAPVGAICGINYSHCCMCCKDKTGSMACENIRPAVCEPGCCS